MASTIWPELTTVRQPIREMTAWAVSAIATIISKKREGERFKYEQKTLPYTLVCRESDSAPSLVTREGRAEERPTNLHRPAGCEPPPGSTTGRGHEDRLGR